MQAAHMLTRFGVCSLSICSPTPLQPRLHTSRFESKPVFSLPCGEGGLVSQKKCFFFQLFQLSQLQLFQQGTIYLC